VIHSLIIFGPIDIRINTSPLITRVDFLLDGALYFSDVTSPFECRLNQKVLLRKANITIQAYADTNSYYEKKMQQCLDNIVLLLTTMQNISELQGVIENLSKMKCIDHPYHGVVSQEFIYLNPFPSISLQLMERGNN